VILRFSPGATDEERGAVAAAVEALGVPVTGSVGILVFGRPLAPEEALGIAALPGVAALLPEDPRAPTLREGLYRWTAASCLVLGLLVLLASHVPHQLAGPADPLRTPADLQPSWPLLAWYAFIDRAPGWVPVTLLPLLGTAVLLGWPWIAGRFADRRPRLHAALGVLALAAFAALAALGVAR